MKSVARPLDFLCIGAPKAGTTSLFHYLRTHPRLYLPPQKEAPFFTLPERRAADWEAFWAAYMSGAPREALVGKVTPQYMGDLGIAARIARLMPSIRLIALLRNPIDRAYSDWRMRRQSAVELRSFEAAVGEQLREPHLAQGRDHKQGTSDPRDLYVVRGEYARILASFLAVFPRHQVLVLFTESMAADPLGTLDRVMRFLELQTGYLPGNLGKIYHRTGESYRFHSFVRGLTRVTPLRRIWHFLPEGTRTSFQYWFLHEFGLVDGVRQAMSPTTRRLLADFYDADVCSLRASLGVTPPWADFDPSLRGIRGL